MDFAKPRIVISRCIEFEAVRWNSQIIRNDFVRSLLPHIEAVTVCPEVGIGLPVPRQTLRLVKQGDDVRLMQPATGKDLTDEMNTFTEEFLNGLPDVDGFILTSRSPSSGLSNVKVYAGIKNAPQVGRTSGVFASQVKARYKHLAVEEDKRLGKSKIREHFLRKLFMLADWRTVHGTGDINDIVAFQTRHKLHLTAYNQKQLRELTRIVANKEEKTVPEVAAEYQVHLYAALRRAPSCRGYIKVLEHALSMFKDELSAEESQFLLDKLDMYVDGKTPLIVPVDIMKAWIIRFKNEYLADQSFFNPYPEDLVDMDSIIEACGERDYWPDEEP